jgi:predicted porin
MEYKIDGETSTGTSLANNARQQMLALAGGFGTVATGYLQTAAWDFAGKYDPVSGSAASPYDNISRGDGFLIGGTAAASRASRALAYISPNIGGLTFAVNYATALADGTGNLTVADPGGTSTKTTAGLASATYADGPLSASVVYAGTNATPATSNASEYALGGSYDLGVTKLSAIYQTQTTNAATSKTNKVYSVSAVVPFGNDAVAVSYAASQMDTASTNSTGYTLGYMHNMSKTVTAYAAYTAMTNDAGAAIGVANTLVAPTAGGNSSLVGFGLRKKF